MGQVLAFNTPEYGDGDGDDEEVVCPECGHNRYMLVPDEDDDEIGVFICERCGTEVGVTDID